jgi:hypothetical protein
MSWAGLTGATSTGTCGRPSVVDPGRTTERPANAVDLALQGVSGYSG